MIKLLQLMINKNCELLTDVSTNRIADSQFGTMTVKVMRSTKEGALRIVQVKFILNT